MIVDRICEKTLDGALMSAGLSFFIAGLGIALAIASTTPYENLMGVLFYVFGLIWGGLAFHDIKRKCR